MEVIGLPFTYLKFRREDLPQVGAFQLRQRVDKRHVVVRVGGFDFQSGVGGFDFGEDGFSHDEYRSNGPNRTYD